MMADETLQPLHVAITSFPSEVLELIFSHFDGATIARASQVCRKWNFILESVTARSDLWFNCCKSEIPHMTLLQLINCPIEAWRQNGLAWRRTYVHWRTHRGDRLWNCSWRRKKTIPRNFPVCGENSVELPKHLTSSNICLTDNVVYLFEVTGDVIAYDIHSDNTIQRKLEHSNPLQDAIYGITASGLHLPIKSSAEKNSFQTDVERTILAVIRASTLEIYAGLQRMICISCRGASICSWFDTILVGVRSPYAGAYVYKLSLVGEGGKDYSISTERGHVLRHYKSTNTEELGAMSIIGNRAVTASRTVLILWDSDTGSQLSCISNPNMKAFYSPLLMSWVGQTIVLTRRQVRFTVTCIYYLNEDCSRVEKIKWMHSKLRGFPSAVQLLHDDSFVIVDSRQAQLVSHCGGDEGEAHASVPVTGSEDDGVFDDDDDSDDDTDTDEEDENHLFDLLYKYPTAMHGAVSEFARLHKGETREPIMGYFYPRGEPTALTMYPSRYMDHSNEVQHQCITVMSPLPHQGCQRELWNWTLKGSLSAMDTNCDAPCQERMIIYEWLL